VTGLSVQVTDLARRLAECELTDKAGVKTSATETETDVTKRLLKDIDTLRKAGAGAGGDTNLDRDGLYQLYLGAPTNRPSLDIAAVEARLTALEHAVGPEIVGKRYALSAATDGRTLQYAADNLTAKKGQFQQQHLDHVEGRLAALNIKINTIGELKAGVVVARQEDKLARLCGLVESQASLASVLPDLVCRLEEVEQVGERAGSWSEILDSTEQSQQNTKKILSESQTAVAATRDTFQGSFASIAEKFSHLQKRLSAISA